LPVNPDNLGPTGLTGTAAEFAAQQKLPICEKNASFSPQKDNTPAISLTKLYPA
jgi:hypothetical protein